MRHHKQQHKATVILCHQNVIYWVRDHVKQGQFHIYWGPGRLNLANYYTKHLSAKHHQPMHQIYLHTATQSNTSNAAMANTLHILLVCV
jgi:hypothetical protein